MANVAQSNLAQPNVGQSYDERQEFWKPAGSPRPELLQSEAVDHACERCGTEFVLGSRFCHVCGADRQATELGDSGHGGAFRYWFDLSGLRETLGHTYGSLAALVLGVICVLAAATTGFLYTATTLLDWQAVQLWRIEWLLAALAAFVAGLLLRKR